MKRPPDCLRIIGKDWHLLCKPDLITTEGAFGLTDSKELRILYSDETTRSQVLDTIIHEVCHAIDFTAGTGLDEHQVHGIAMGLYAVLADNPEFCQWLFSAFKPAS